MVTIVQHASQDVVQQALNDLVGLRREGNNSFVSLPLLYPSGSSVVVRIFDEGRTFLVTDMGLGWDEVEMMGATHQMYLGIARKIADASGVVFDNHSFFVLQVTKNQLSGAIAAVANCSLEAAIQSAYAFAEKKINEGNERLYLRLDRVFTPRKVKVERYVTIRGASSHEWPVSNLVRMGPHGAIFEAVAKHANSVSNVATKFMDISRADASPHCIAVVQSKAEFGNYSGVLAPVARIIEQSANDDTLLSLVA